MAKFWRQPKALSSPSLTVFISKDESRAPIHQEPDLVFCINRTRCLTDRVCIFTPAIGHAIRFTSVAASTFPNIPYLQLGNCNRTKKAEPAAQRGQRVGEEENRRTRRPGDPVKRVWRFDQCKAPYRDELESAAYNRTWYYSCLKAFNNTLFEAQKQASKKVGIGFALIHVETTLASKKCARSGVTWHVTIG